MPKFYLNRPNNYDRSISTNFFHNIKAGFKKKKKKKKKERERQLEINFERLALMVSLITDFDTKR
jgi:hypothetical protein